MLDRIGFETDRTTPPLSAILLPNFDRLPVTWGAVARGLKRFGENG